MVFSLASLTRCWRIRYYPVALVEKSRSFIRWKMRQLPVPRRSQVNALTGVVQEEVPVVKDYLDVFPEELPGMPPDRDIEFLIEFN